MSGGAANEHPVSLCRWDIGNRKCLITHTHTHTFVPCDILLWRHKHTYTTRPSVASVCFSVSLYQTQPTDTAILFILHPSMLIMIMHLWREIRFGGTFNEMEQTDREGDGRGKWNKGKVTSCLRDGRQSTMACLSSVYMLMGTVLILARLISH